VRVEASGVLGNTPSIALPLDGGSHARIGRRATTVLAFLVINARLARGHWLRLRMMTAMGLADEQAPAWPRDGRLGLCALDGGRVVGRVVLVLGCVLAAMLGPAAGVAVAQGNEILAVASGGSIQAAVNQGAHDLQGGAASSVLIEVAGGSIAGT
jgi:hypothetical protein